MKAEPLHSVSLRFPSNRKIGPAPNEEAIQACCDLLSSGQPLSEILVTLKQLSPLNNSQSQFGGAAAKAPISSPSAEIPGALLQCAVTEIAEPVGASRSVVLLDVESSQHRARDEKKSSPIGAVLFWLIPALSLMTVGIAGKLLIDAGLLRNGGKATVAADTAAPMPAITEVGGTIPELSKATSAGEPSLTGSLPERATQPVGTAPANNQDRGALIEKRVQERPVTRSLASAAPIKRGLAPLSQSYPSPPGWRIPRRLTDGF